MNLVPPTITTSRNIDYIEHVPTYDYFLVNYLNPLRPLVFLDPDLSNSWSSYSQLICKDLKGNLVPNIDAFVEIFRGKSSPLVSREVRHASASYGAEDRTDIVINESFATRWKQVLESESGTQEYLKDFHLCLARPDLELYQTYPIFQDDWMNAYALHCTRDDYRFLYLGSDGTETGFHHDVYLSHSWSTSLCGIKRWDMVSPQDAHLLLHSRTREPIQCLFDDSVDTSEYPGVLEARKRCKVVWQFPSETVFVPSGWYHSVKNYGPTLSINHNWANASCIQGMYDALVDQVEQSVLLMEDLRDGMPKQEFFTMIYTQLVTPSWGWGFQDFFQLIAWVLKHPNGGESWLIPSEVSQGFNHAGVRELMQKLAQSWLEREEAEYLIQIQGIVENILELTLNSQKNPGEILPAY
ncbi:hypothetical protein DL96DRAFT_1712122 [Flagelloscypha sp. PMI_526]|nr:hypothetical protein DL96DRAFT_1712122 [Flagelloscypha sp. PMI_526]